MSDTTAGIIGFLFCLMCLALVIIGVVFIVRKIKKTIAANKSKNERAKVRNEQIKNIVD